MVALPLAPAVDAGRVWVLGGGRVGSALAALLARQSAGIEVSLWSRSGAVGAAMVAARGGAVYQGPHLPSALACGQTVILAVSDDAIGVVAQQLDPLLGPDARVLHCSGAHSARSVLGALGARPLGTLHPLVAVRGIDQALRALPGAHFALEGDDEAVAVAATLCQTLGVRWVRIAAEGMGLYHAAAVIASNHAVALWYQAQALLVRSGVADAERATAMLLPLLRSTIENVERFGLPDALTGPVRRGDLGTIETHLQSLAGDPGLAASYRADARLALRAALKCEGGASGAYFASLERLLGREMD